MNAPQLKLPVDPKEKEYTNLSHGRVNHLGNLIPFDQLDLPVFPVSIFPEWLQKYVLNVADASQTPVDASGMAALSVLSAALAKKFVIRPFTEGSWTETNNLYTVVVLPSGERKSLVHGLLVKPIIEFEKIMRDQFSNDVVADATMKPKLRRFVADDVTPEKLVELLQDNGERMAILSAEGGLFEMLDGKRYGNNPFLDVYLKAYTGDYVAVDRVGRPSEVINTPILTISSPNQTSYRAFLSV